MLNDLQPWHVLLASLAGWVNQHQQRAIEYLREENRVLREQLGRKRLRLTDDQRRRLAAKGETLRKLLGEIATLAVVASCDHGVSRPLPSRVVAELQAILHGASMNHKEAEP